MHQTKSIVLACFFMAFTFSNSVVAANTASEYRQLGLLYRKQGRNQEAIAAMRKSVELEPQNPTGKINLGWTLHLSGQRQEAAQYLWQAVSQQPFKDSAYNALGIVYLVDGNLTAAVAIHTWAIILKPQNEVAYYNLSLALHRLKIFNLAIATANYAASLEPNNPHPLVASAIVYWDSGNHNLAVNAYKKAIYLDNRYRNNSFLAHLQQAAFCQEQINTVKQILINSK
ncbi:MAG: tetratricopeptide repeat protein [Calothrix sp. C42_A2020_038]|nr:tetratricopeptide repeat protein [Calothrix sp. C42_A2020_038]